MKDPQIALRAGMGIVSQIRSLRMCSAIDQPTTALVWQSITRSQVNSQSVHGQDRVTAFTRCSVIQDRTPTCVRERRFVLREDCEDIVAGRICNETRVRCYVTLSGVCVTVPGLKVGCGRASTRDQNPDAQRDSLTAADCDQAFVDSVDRPTTGNTRTDQYSYDPLGRQSALAAADAPNRAAGDPTLAYHDSDLPHAVTQTGVTTGDTLNVNGHRQTATTTSTGPGSGLWSCDAPLLGPVHSQYTK